MKTRLLNLAQFLANKGLPLPWFRDPITKLPSVSLTLTVLSFLACIAGLLNKMSGHKWLGEIDETSAFNLFLATSALYWGRKVSNGLMKVDDSTTAPPKE